MFAKFLGHPSMTLCILLYVDGSFLGWFEHVLFMIGRLQVHLMVVRLFLHGLASWHGSWHELKLPACVLLCIAELAQMVECPVFPLASKFGHLVFCSIVQARHAS